MGHNDQLQRSSYLLRSIDILLEQEAVIVKAMPLSPQDPRHARLIVLRNATRLLSIEQKALLESDGTPDFTPPPPG